MGLSEDLRKQIEHPPDWFAYGQYPEFVYLVRNNAAFWGATLISYRGALHWTYIQYDIAVIQHVLSEYSAAYPGLSSYELESLFMVNSTLGRSFTNRTAINAAIIMADDYHSAVYCVGYRPAPDVARLGSFERSRAL